VTNSAGENISAAPILNPRYTFTGRELDEESKNYYYRARYYDASSGRFLQQDPEPGKPIEPSTLFPRYTYVANAPTFRTDPSGRLSQGSIVATGDERADTDQSDVHGYYCGYSAQGQNFDNWDSGNSKGQHNTPIDRLDNACRYHDEAYGNQADWLSLNNAGRRLESDFSLFFEGIAYMRVNPIQGLAVAIAAVAYVFADFVVLTPINIIIAILNIRESNFKTKNLFIFYLDLFFRFKFLRGSLQPISE
jgi:RHS repeat-associated protein